MEKFKNQLKTRFILNCVAVVVFALVIALLSYTVSGRMDEEGPEIYFLGFQTGAATAFTGMLLIFALRLGMALRNPEKLRKLYVAETDERRCFVAQKTGSTGIKAAIGGLFGAAIAAGYYNFTVFVTLIGACLFVCAIVISMKVYYSAKY